MGRRRLALIALAVALLAASAQARELRVCADPNNLPFSNAAGEGFENRIMALLAKDLGARLEYTWWAQRRGFVRNTLDAGRCDVIAGVPSNLERLATTQPYYRSTYVFLSRADRKLDLRSFDDVRLRSLRIGVQLVGDDGNNTPPVHALARRGISGNLKGYTVYGDYREATPQSAIVDGVASDEIDVAIAWGPTAGYFAAREPVAITATPVEPWLDGPGSPMVFDISMAVRKDDRELRRQLDAALARHRAEIGAILAEFHVPVVVR
jgi:mxaJ protein